MTAERAPRVDQGPPYRIAIVHDALVTFGGAERVVAAWMRQWPEAPIYTSAYLAGETFPEFQRAQINTSFLQRLTRNPQTLIRRLSPLMVAGFWSFDLSGFDVVLSSSAYAAKTVRVPDTTCHICYCYSPLRLAWRADDYLGSNAPWLKRIGLNAIVPLLRRWDYAVSQGVDFFATTSQNVKERILAAYGRDAEVIPAPVDLARYRLGEGPGDFYLVVSRLTRYKRADLAVDVMARLGRRLVVVGDGPERHRLRAMAGRSVTFLGTVSEEVLLDLYSRCRALIFPQEEDYGLAPLEAMASGRPVVAFGAGGARETVVDGETGVFFMEQTGEALLEAVQRAERIQFDQKRIRDHAARFAMEPYCDRLGAFVEARLREFRLRGT